MITFYGSFITRGTYNVVLEYADRGTLEDYLTTVEEPREGLEILNLWTGLLKILDPLAKIHTLPHSADDPTGLGMFSGYESQIL